MQQALSAPVFRSIAVGGVLLAVGAASVLTRDEPETLRLSLYAEKRCNAIYVSAWHRGDVVVTVPGDELPPLTFRTRAKLFGCQVLGIETLVPIDDRTYAYDYRETIVSCEPGAEPPVKTPRRGIVRAR